MSYIFNPLQNEGFIPIIESQKVSDHKYTLASNSPLDPNIGDFWDEINDQGLVQQWFWNGNYWLSKQEYQHFIEGFVSYNQSSFRFANNCNLYVKQARLISRMDSDISPGGNFDSNANYWEVLPRLLIGGSGDNPLPNASILSTKGRTYRQYGNIFLTSSPINTLITIAPNGNEPDLNGFSLARGASYVGSKFGSPPDLYITLILLCNFARA